MRMSWARLPTTPGPLSEEFLDSFGKTAGIILQALTWDPKGVAPRQTRIIRLLLHIGIVLDAYGVYSMNWGFDDKWMIATGIVGALVAFPRLQRLSTVLLLGTYIRALMAGYPYTWNHTWLGAVALLFLCLGDPDDEESCGLMLGGLRATLIYAMFGAAIQKILHGTYWRGEFLALQAPGMQNPWFVRDFLMTSADWALYSNENAWQSGMRIAPNSPVLIFASIMTVVGELVAGVWMMFPRTRKPALVASVLLMLPIQIAAFEYLFLGILVTLLATLEDRAWIRFLVPVLGFTNIGLVIYRVAAGG